MYKLDIAAMVSVSLEEPIDVGCTAVIVELAWPFVLLMQSNVTTRTACLISRNAIHESLLVAGVKDGRIDIHSQLLLTLSSS